MLFTADSIGDFCLPSRSTWAVAGFRGLNQQLYTSSSKPRGAGSRWKSLSPHTQKKSGAPGKERGILLVVISCCAPPSVAPWWSDGLDGERWREKIWDVMHSAVLSWNVFTVLREKWPFMPLKAYLRSATWRDDTWLIKHNMIYLSSIYLSVYLLFICCYQIKPMLHMSSYIKGLSIYYKE